MYYDPGPGIVASFLSLESNRFSFPIGIAFPDFPIFLKPLRVKRADSVTIYAYSYCYELEESYSRPFN